ncbi:MAG: hypothetical protein ACK5KU_09255 [Beutenbergiaceae bacterium]
MPSNESTIDTVEVIGAADKMDSAATAIGANRPLVVGDVAEAMPGSSSSGAATTLEERWKGDYDALVRAFEHQSDAMRAAANDWTGVDQLASTQFSSLSVAGWAQG